jgi:integrase
MSQKIYNLLKSIDNNSNYVFSSRGSHFDIKWTEKYWLKTLKGTNLEGKKFHDLRHTFATMLLLNGANLIQIKELLGHSSVKITEMYLDALPKSKQEIVNKIDYLLH